MVSFFDFNLLNSVWCRGGLKAPPINLTTRMGIAVSWICRGNKQRCKFWSLIEALSGVYTAARTSPFGYLYPSFFLLVPTLMSVCCNFDIWAAGSSPAIGLYMDGWMDWSPGFDSA